MSREKLEEGFTWRSVLAILYSLAIVGPVMVYSSLATGVFYAGAAVYITIILFTEIGRLTGIKPRKQDLFIVYTIVQTLVSPSIFFLQQLIYQAYFKSSTYSSIYIHPISGKPIADMLPDWFAPSSTLKILELRTFFDPAWILPFAVVLSMFFLTIIAELSLGIFFSCLFIEVENLPFPTAPLVSESCITLAERDPEKIRFFTVSAVACMIWSANIYLIPSLTGAVIGYGITYLPGYIDLNYWLQRALPGASFAVTLDPIFYIWGFVLPKSVCASLLVGSLMVYFFGNAIALQFPLDVFKEWREEWFPNMMGTMAMTRSQLWMWTPFLIGGSLALAISTLILGRQRILATFKALSRSSSSSASGGYLSLPIVIGLYLVASGASVAVYYYLNPGFNILVLVVTSMVWPFIIALISSRAVAETGVYYIPTNTQSQQAIIVGSGYTGVTGWLMPMYVGQTSFAAASSVVLNYKAAYLTGTKPSSYLKSYLLMTPLAIFFGFLFLAFFWRMAPIPSAIFPATVYTYPNNAINQSFLITQAPNIFKPSFIAAGFITMFFLVTINTIKPLWFLSPTSILIGMLYHPYNPFADCIGYVIAIFLSKYIIGFDRNRPVILAGATAGTGLMIGLAAAIDMISRAMWPKPF